MFVMFERFVCDVCSIYTFVSISISLGQSERSELSERSERYNIRRLYLPTVDSYGWGCRLFFYFIFRMFERFSRHNLFIHSNSHPLFIFMNNLCATIFILFISIVRQCLPIGPNTHYLTLLHFILRQTFSLPFIISGRCPEMNHITRLGS